MRWAIRVARIHMQRASMQRNYDFMYRTEGSVLPHYNSIVSVMERFHFDRPTFVYGGLQTEGTAYAIVYTNKRSGADEAGLEEWLFKNVKGKRVYAADKK